MLATDDAWAQSEVLGWMREAGEINGITSPSNHAKPND